MSLILILRLRLLSYAVELVQVLLPVLLFLLLLVHAITSGVVCAGAENISPVNPRLIQMQKFPAYPL